MIARKRVSDRAFYVQVTDQVRIRGAECSVVPQRLNRVGLRSSSSRGIDCGDPHQGQQRCYTRKRDTVNRRDTVQQRRDRSRKQGCAGQAERDADSIKVEDSAGKLP